MSKDEEMKSGVKSDTFDFSSGLEKFLSEFDTGDASEKADAIDLSFEEAAAEEAADGDKVENRETESAETEETAEKGTDSEVKVKAEDVVVDLMTDASTSEITGKLPTKDQISAAGQDQMADLDAQMDAAIEKLVLDTVGTMGLHNNTSANQNSAAKPEKKLESEEEEVEEEPKTRKKMKTSIKVLLVLLFLSVAALGGYYGYQAYYFMDHFFPNTSINGVAAAELGVDEVEEQIKAAAEDYTITLDFREHKTEKIKGQDIDYHYVSTGEVAELLASQNVFLWFLEMNRDHDNTVQVPMEYDESKLDEVLKGLREMNPANMTAPTDAFCDFKETEFVIIDETYGSTIKTDELKTVVNEAVAGGETVLDMEEAGVYVEPAIKNNDKDLVKHLDDLNEWISGSVTYQVPRGEDIVLDSKVLVNWLSADANGLLEKNEEHWNQKMKEFVAELAEQVDSLGKTQYFPATGIGEVAVRQSGYGWEIDQEAEVEQLKQELEAKEPVERAPLWASEPFSDVNNGFGYSYVEVDASRQHVWVYVDGDCVVSTDCVTGMMIRDRYTPSGIFRVRYKQKDTFLRGPVQEDGSYAWESHVDYWMPFNNGIGLHDASWRGSFGGGIYVNGGSHGCVNLPRWAAQEIYSYIDSGFPVIVYYSDGCRFE